MKVVEDTAYSTLCRRRIDHYPACAHDRSKFVYALIIVCIDTRRMPETAQVVQLYAGFYSGLQVLPDIKGKYRGKHLAGKRIGRPNPFLLRDYYLCFRRHTDTGQRCDHLHRLAHNRWAHEPSLRVGSNLFNLCCSITVEEIR